MTDHHEEDELAPTQTTGYKPGEKKTLEEYQSLDAQDESLKKWKESLGLNNAANGKWYSLPPFLFILILIIIQVLLMIIVEYDYSCFLLTVKLSLNT